jgi:hypothetical protein
MSQEQPHGWGMTKTGQKQHYFGLTRDGLPGYRSDGTALALCHNALKLEGEIADAKNPESDVCYSCQDYALVARKSLRIRQAQAKPVTDELKPFQQRVVTRGKFTGKVMILQRESRAYPGFWECVYTIICGQAGERARDALVSAGQLGGIVQ